MSKMQCKQPQVVIKKYYAKQNKKVCLVKRQRNVKRQFNAATA